MIEPVFVNRKALLYRLAIVILGVAAIITLYSFFDLRKHDYFNLLKDLRNYSLGEIIQKNDPYNEMRRVAEDFDADANSVMFMSSDKKWAKNSLQYFQTDYYFYPEVPALLHFDPGDDLNVQLIGLTVSGDVVVSMEDLQLDSGEFSVWSSFDYFMYVKK